jgi:stage V sporulation protein D (sporulation-specific penicillin-binding protein)
LQAESRLGPVELATTCIGQGISVTPLQMITAVSAVANGGKLLKPQIVYQVKDGNTIIEDFEVQQVRQVISAETSSIICSILEEVATSGTGRQAFIEGYRVGGKTGTAQKPGPGGYVAGKYVASFVGMAPVNDPQVVCLIFVDEPVRGHHQGSMAAAPVFRAVMEDTMRYLGVVPQLAAAEVPGERLSEEVQVPNVLGLNAEAARELLQLSGLKVDTHGAGNIVISQSPEALSMVGAGAAVVISLAGSAGEQLTVPDLSGKRLSAAAEMLTSLGLKLSAAGAGGLAYEQDPPPGTLISAGGTVKVKFGSVPEEE